MRAGPPHIGTPSRRRCLVGIGLALGGLALAPAARAQLRPTPPPEFRRQSPDQETLTIVTLSGEYPFLVDILFNRGTPDSALKSRPPLQQDEAILYAVDVVRPIALSNRGVPFATDILFIAADGRIIGIHAAIMANDPAVFVSAIPVKAALQTLGGTVRRLAIRPGDHVLQPMFGRTL
jgi:uncharacterized protein